MSTDTGNPLNEFAYLDESGSRWLSSAENAIDLFQEQSPPFSGRWPKSGMTRGGRAYELPTLERLTIVPGSLSSLHLPTPTASDADKERDNPAQANRHSPPLSAVTQHFPTPTATPYGSNQSPSDGAAVRPSLDGIVRMLPTPTASLGEHRNDNGQDPQKRRDSGHQASLADVTCYLPTPAASDGTGGGQHPDKRQGHTGQLIDAVLGLFDLEED